MPGARRRQHCNIDPVRQCSRSSGFNNARRYLQTHSDAWDVVHADFDARNEVCYYDFQMTQFVTGDSVELRASFTDASDAFVDPDVVDFSVIDPNDVRTDYTYVTDVELVKEDVGRYLVYVLLDTHGYWRVRWAGTGTLASAEETSITVRPSILT